jgi:hypothetical protein
MKNLIFIVFCLSGGVCFSQSFIKKRTLIPLNNLSGVPYYIDKETSDYDVDGFEIDSAGKFYFLGNYQPVTLAVFAGNKQILRKTYKDIAAAQLYIYKNQLYTFNIVPHNVLVVLDKKTGIIKTKYSHGVKNNRPFKYMFVDSSLVTESLVNSQSDFQQYNLTGKHIKPLSSLYNIDSLLILMDMPSNDIFSDKLVGVWNGNYVFYGLTDDQATDTYWLVAKNGQVLATKTIPSNNTTFGEGYAENPDEHRKVRNSSLYILGRKGKYALITEVSLQDFFYGKP